LDPFFFPAFVKARELIAAGEIGEVHFAQADFGVAFPKNIERIWNPNMAGGGILDLGVYPITEVVMLLANDGKERPLEIKATGRVEQGVDIYGSVTLTFPNNKMAIATWHTLVQTEEETIIVGTKGSIKLHSPAHCPIKLTLTRRIDRDNVKTEVFEFPRPTPAPGTTKFNFLGSNGFLYEAIAVQEQIAAGKTESDVLPPEVSLNVIGIIDEARRQIGLKYPFEQDGKIH